MAGCVSLLSNSQGCGVLFKYVQELKISHYISLWNLKYLQLESPLIVFLKQAQFAKTGWETLKKQQDVMYLLSNSGVDTALDSPNDSWEEK